MLATTLGFSEIVLLGSIFAVLIWNLCKKSK